MLLENNSKKLIDLIYQFDKLGDIDKVRLAIYLLENKNFDTDFNIRDMIILLKEILSKLDLNYKNTLANFNIGNIQK